MQTDIHAKQKSFDSLSDRLKKSVDEATLRAVRGEITQDVCHKVMVLALTSQEAALRDALAWNDRNPGYGLLISDRHRWHEELVSYATIVNRRRAVRS